MTSEDTTIKKAKRVFKKGKRKPSFDPKAKFGSKSKSKIFEEEIREVDRKLGEVCIYISIFNSIKSQNVYRFFYSN